MSLVGNYLQARKPRTPRRLRNAIGRAQGFGSCYHCHDTWNYSKEHATYYDNGFACFALCQRCWQQMTPNQRMPYYMLLISNWIRQAPDERAIAKIIGKWPKITAAVQQGL